MAETPIRKTSLERLEYAIIVSTLLFLVVMTVQPLLNLLAISFSDPTNVAGMNGLTILPHGFSPEVWSLLIQHPQVQRGVINSIFITVASTVLGVAFTALMAWGLSRPNLPGRRFIFILVLVTIVFEPGIIPDYFINKRLGLLDTYWAPILFKLVNAWYLIILIRFFEEIPSELLEASELDGANPFQVFWTVVLPLARPALATITLFYFVFHWNEFFRAMIYLNDQSKWPLQVVLRQFVVEGDKLMIVGKDASDSYSGASQINIRALKAGMILLTIVPILAIYPLILKFFTKGTMSGALKG
ncbi:putative ABC transporter permease protein YtcP [Youhaiella tibetensis]|uniref:Carbohydrate ABC transporter permease n=1 Tax=Paradevosia tibetensis TaxID=1447062 RepID=A0A5B9DR88_9HYPH|nr:carbohydrate ABC transporter permease [Youhaiella tibetensis]QEE21737.1 carbohydrate ABC transporter permease [Youhaiella tibetensis]GGF12124.1 putative ABC transporter permease protein YtcP [Youhaiella tibetensis]